MKSILRYVLLATAIILSGCGGDDSETPGDPSEFFSHPGTENTPPSQTQGNTPEAKVRARATLDLSTGSEADFNIRATNSVQIPISIDVAPNCRFEIDASEFHPPVYKNERVHLGSLAVIDLYDNHLVTCGVDGQSKCSSAEIRMYTIAAGPGLWNVRYGYGAPLFVRAMDEWFDIPWQQSHALALERMEIPSDKWVIDLDDFNSDNLKYGVDVDFSNAGSGNYYSDLVIEYVLLGEGGLDPFPGFDPPPSQDPAQDPTQSPQQSPDQSPDQSPEQSPQQSPF